MILWGNKLGLHRFFKNPLNLKEPLWVDWLFHFEANGNWSKRVFTPRCGTWASLGDTAYLNHGNKNFK